MQRRAQLARTTILAWAAEQFDRHGYTHAALHDITRVPHESLRAVDVSIVSADRPGHVTLTPLLKPK
ncbi:hypothetical protein [Rhodococcus opacus]|uniref:hypothetical protein n=1 Tax=Rhodococcus opacus TaxID=37919 RepID=UPI00155A18A5|nr:hypothetical protein [Rhodococcus opacus]